MDVAREETFGPVVPITAHRGDMDEALAIVNALAVRAADGDLHARPRPRPALRRVGRAGWVNINEGTNYWESHLPFGGRAGSQSGVGRVGGRSRSSA